MWSPETTQKRGVTEKMIKELRWVTKCISNKGFSGNSSILPRIKFGVGGQESRPQSLTASTLNRYATFKKKKYS